MAIPAFFKIASEVSKAKNVAEGDVTSVVTKGIKKFNPDKRIDTKDAEPIRDNAQKFDPDKRLKTGNEVVLENKVPIESDMPSDIDIHELMDHPGVLDDLRDVKVDELADKPDKIKADSKTDVPKEDELVTKGELYTDQKDREAQASGSDGEWSGEPGKSEFTPNNPDAKHALEKHGEESIRYDTNSEPDFSKVSDETVEIDNMTENRLGAGNNFDQADAKVAEKWNKENREGKSDWTKEDVKDWVDKNHLTRHERLDKKTVDYVDSGIHDACKHYGGCAECRVRDSIGGNGFDE